MELAEEDAGKVAAWLDKFLYEDELKKLARSGEANLDAVLGHLSKRARTPRKLEVAASIVRRFDADLLADEDRRRLLTKAWNRHHDRKLRVPDKWFRGGPRSHELVHELGLPAVLAGARAEGLAQWEDIDAYPPLGPLHSYQHDLYGGVKRVLTARGWKKRRGLVWLPTGTGKTRVLVEALLRECSLAGQRNVILWIADRGELCEQAVEAFRHVWQEAGWGCGSDPEHRLTDRWRGAIA